MPKNIIVFSDGTGQEGGKGFSTNIYKMYNMVEDRTDNQIAFYDRGVGTDWRRITGNLIGNGISQNVLECYRFIFDNFKAGDQIFLFGFSRGATTIRSLSGFIHTFGILPKSRPELIDQAWKVYENKKNCERLARKFLSNHHNMWTKIKFLGCFDTVTALGLPWKWANAIVSKIPLYHYKFHNLEISQSVEYARFGNPFRKPKETRNASSNSGSAASTPTSEEATPKPASPTSPLIGCLKRPGKKAF